jgi:hypothetical protein
MLPSKWNSAAFAVPVEQIKAIAEDKIIFFMIISKKY